MNILKLIAGLVVAALLVVFVAQNPQTVTIHFLMFKIPSAPMVFALFAAALLGALLGWVVSAPGRFQRMRERHGLKDQVAARDRATAADSDMHQRRVS